MGYSTFQADRERWSERKGLEGPFFYPNGRVIYYDPREGRYWDPRTDFYLDHEEAAELKQDFLNVFKR